MLTRLIIHTLLILSPILSSAQSITDGLQLFYRLDSSAIDFTSNDFEGMVSGPLAVEDEDLTPNSAFYFDGMNDFIDFPVDPILKPSLPFTYSLRVKFETLDQVFTYMFTSDHAENNYHGTWANLTADGSGRVSVSFSAGLGNNGSGNRRTKSSEDAVTPQKWYQLTFVVRGATDMDIYIDCLDAGGSYSGSGSAEVAYSNIPGTIGRRDAHSGNDPYYFNGTIDNFVFWNRALSQLEVVSLCNNILGTEDQIFDLDRKLHVYPNPTSGQSTFEFENPKNHSCLVRIVDLQGKVVYTERTSFKSTSIQVAQKVSNGVYLCSIFDEVEKTTLGLTRLVVD